MGDNAALGQIRFQSTSSVWRTTYNLAETDEIKKISIHVLRVEDDNVRLTDNELDKHFNPRPPCGGRQ